MPNLTLYHLTPHGPFHLSLRGVGQEKTEIYLPSDSLFAALLAAHVEAGGKADDLVRTFPHSQDSDSSETKIDNLTVPFLLTSTFPRAGNLRFYPVPPSLTFLISAAKLTKLEEEGRLKEVKKIQFLSEGLFQKMVNGERLDDWLPTQDKPQPTDRGLYLQGNSLWLMADEAKHLPEAAPKEKDLARLYRALRQFKIWQVNETPRVTIDRLSNASEIYYTGRVTFSPECGWWFGLAWNQPEAVVGQDGQTMRQVVTQALNLLADAGLGGERVAGYGHFCWQEQTESRAWPDPTSGDLFLTLSRYHPEQAELPNMIRADLAAYKLISVGGWLGSPIEKAQRRRRLWLIAEGSVLRAAGRHPWGDIVDVRPIYPGVETEFSHPVWRYGLACPVQLTRPDA